MNNSRIFIDISVLVEYRKGNKLPFLNTMLADVDSLLCISQAVASEYLFHHLGIVGGKPPLTIKMSNSIAQTLQVRDPTPFLHLFTWLPDDPTMLPLATGFMSKYNLLPNDALILAAITVHDIPALASFDPDFAAPCRGEGIHLLQTPKDFEGFKKSLI